MSLKAKSIRESFLEHLWTNYVRNELDWGLPFQRNMEFSHAAAVMDRTGGWEEGKEEENQTPFTSPLGKRHTPRS